MSNITVAVSYITSRPSKFSFICKSPAPAKHPPSGLHKMSSYNTGCYVQPTLRKASDISLQIYEQHDRPILDQFLREHADGFTMHYCINFDDEDIIICMVAQVPDIDPPQTRLPLKITKSNGGFQEA